MAKNIKQAKHPTHGIPHTTKERHTIPDWKCHPNTEADNLLDATELHPNVHELFDWDYVPTSDTVAEALYEDLSSIGQGFRAGKSFANQARMMGVTEERLAAEVNDDMLDRFGEEWFKWLRDQSWGEVQEPKRMGKVWLTALTVAKTGGWYPHDVKVEGHPPDMQVNWMEESFRCWRGFFRWLANNGSKLGECYSRSLSYETLLRVGPIKTEEEVQELLEEALIQY